MITISTRILFLLSLLFLFQAEVALASRRTMKPKRIPRQAKQTGAVRNQRKKMQQCAQTQAVKKKRGRQAEKAQAQEKRDLLRKAPKTMTKEELLHAKACALALKDYDVVAGIIQQQIITTQDEDQKRALRLELADTYFDKGDFKRASRYYQEYVTLYPGSKHKDIDYARYKDILCHFYMSLKSPVDQSKTRETLALITAYLQQEATHAQYVEEVEKIRYNCYEKLFEHESIILTFYSRQGVHAETRLQDLKKEFEPVMEAFAPRIIALEILLARAEGNTAMEKQKEEELTTNFPDHYSPVLVHNRRRKTNADRF